MKSPRSPKFRHDDKDISVPHGVLADGEAKSAVKPDHQQQSALDRYAVMLLTQAPGAQIGNVVDFMDKSSRSKCSSTSSQF